jgi:hypothetical protein
LIQIKYVEIRSTHAIKQQEIKFYLWAGGGRIIWGTKMEDRKAVVKVVRVMIDALRIFV